MTSVPLCEGYRCGACARCVNRMRAEISYLKDKLEDIERDTRWCIGHIVVNGEVLTVRFRGQMFVSPVELSPHVRWEVCETGPGSHCPDEAGG